MLEVEQLQHDVLILPCRKREALFAQVAQEGQLRPARLVGVVAIAKVKVFEQGLNDDLGQPVVQRRDPRLGMPVLHLIVAPLLGLFLCARTRLLDDALGVHTLRRYFQPGWRHRRGLRRSRLGRGPGRHWLRHGLRLRGPLLQQLVQLELERLRVAFGFLAPQFGVRIGLPGRLQLLLRRGQPPLQFGVLAPQC
eukprot:scaffold18878_cov104-Isochrysis_galbana.AAC.1